MNKIQINYKLLLSLICFGLGALESIARESGSFVTGERPTASSRSSFSGPEEHVDFKTLLAKMFIKTREKNIKIGILEKMQNVLRQYRRFYFYEPQNDAFQKTMDFINQELSFLREMNSTELIINKIINEENPKIEEIFKKMERRKRQKLTLLFNSLKEIHAHKPRLATIITKITKHLNDNQYIIDPSIFFEVSSLTTSIEKDFYGLLKRDNLDLLQLMDFVTKEKDSLYKLVEKATEKVEQDPNSDWKLILSNGDLQELIFEVETRFEKMTNVMNIFKEPVNLKPFDSDVLFKSFEDFCLEEEIPLKDFNMENALISEQKSLDEKNYLFSLLNKLLLEMEESVFIFKDMMKNVRFDDMERIVSLAESLCTCVKKRDENLFELEFITLFQEIPTRFMAIKPEYVGNSGISEFIKLLNLTTNSALCIQNLLSY